MGGGRIWKGRGGGVEGVRNRPSCSRPYPPPLDCHPPPSSPRCRRLASWRTRDGTELRAGTHVFAVYCDNVMKHRVR